MIITLDMTQCAQLEALRVATDAAFAELVRLETKRRDLYVIADYATAQRVYEAAKHEELIAWRAVYAAQRQVGA